MKKVYLYNSLSRKKEEFKAIAAPKVGLYTCGPTVYNYAHIGNLRSYLFEDILKRVLSYNGYNVYHVQNVTDVGHLTGDMDMGEDKIELGASREGLSAWDLVDKYFEAFKQDLSALNIIAPDIWDKVTDNIPEQIELIKTLEQKGYVYQTSDGLYFDTSKFKDYNKLSHLDLDQLREGARVERNEEKKNSTDFALWKFSPKDKKRQMEWNSPWGIGFPGWHLECSAISLKHLEDNLDIHCGGIDHINVHHTNEIAQSEASTGKKFFNYWLHGAFMNILGGKKMSKSANNFLTLKSAFIDKGLNPLAFRFLTLQLHYRKPMEYSPEIVKQAQSALDSFYRHFSLLKTDDKALINKDLKDKFVLAINDDLNMPQALAIANSVFKANISEGEKRATLLDFDKILGLSIKDILPDEEKELSEEELSPQIKELIAKRRQAKEERDFSSSDSLREQIESAGFKIKDEKQGFKIYRN